MRDRDTVRLFGAGAWHLSEGEQTEVAGRIISLFQPLYDDVQANIEATGR